MDGKEFYYKEWKIAEKYGGTGDGYANYCKEKYRDLVMESIIKPHHFYNERLKRYPLICLN